MSGASPKTARQAKPAAPASTKAAGKGKGARQGTKATQTRAQALDEAEPTKDGLKEAWEKLTAELTADQLEDLRRGARPAGVAKPARDCEAIAARTVSVPAKAAQTRGGARPGAGRPRRTSEEIRDWRFEVNGLRDSVILEMLAILEKGKTWERVLEDLAHLFPKYQWPMSPGKREEEALERCHGAGVRLAAQWYAGRVLGMSASLVRDYCTGRALQPTIPGTPPVRLPPPGRAPVPYWKAHYQPETEPERTDELRRLARALNRQGIVRYCEACGKTLSAKQVRACSRPCAKVANELASRRAHGR